MPQNIATLPGFLNDQPEPYRFSFKTALNYFKERLDVLSPVSENYKVLNRVLRGLMIKSSRKEQLNHLLSEREQSL